MWNTKNPETPGRYLAILFKAATENRGVQQWLSVEEWEGDDWNTLGNVYTQVIGWQLLPDPYTEGNPGDWINSVEMYFENRNIPINGEEVLVTVYDWETEEIKVIISTFFDGPGFDCEDDSDLNVEAWKKLPLIVK